MSTDTPYAHSINTTESLSNSRQCKIELIIPKLEPVSKLKQFKGGISEHAEELVIKLTYTYTCTIHVHVHVRVRTHVHVHVHTTCQLRN